MTSLEYLNLAIRLAAASQVVLILVYVLVSQNPFRVKAATVLFLLGSMAYLLMPTFEKYLPIYDDISFLWFFASIVPCMLLLVVQFIFEEDCQCPYWVLAIVGVSVGGSLYYQMVGVGLPGSPLWLQLLGGLSAIAAVLIVLHGRDNDLVELRSKLRLVFVLLISVETLMLVVFEIMTHYSPPLLLDTIVLSAVMVCFFGFSFMMLRLNPSGMFMKIESPIEHVTEDPMLQRLLERMEEERLYADHDLRVGSLASLMNVPEYKLRQKINQELGYRNFNQFVNRYRIEEAGVKLLEQTRTPVLSIALDVGFRSISSFNSAFQAHFGVSPTKYRNDGLTES